MIGILEPPRKVKKRLVQLRKNSLSGETIIHSVFQNVGLQCDRAKEDRPSAEQLNYMFSFLEHVLSAESMANVSAFVTDYVMINQALDQAAAAQKTADVECHELSQLAAAWAKAVTFETEQAKSTLRYLLIVDQVGLCYKQLQVAIARSAGLRK